MVDTLKQEPQELRSYSPLAGCFLLSLFSYTSYGATLQKLNEKHLQIPLILQHSVVQIHKHTAGLRQSKEPRIIIIRSATTSS